MLHIEATLHVLYKPESGRIVREKSAGYGNIAALFSRTIQKVKGAIMVKTHPKKLDQKGFTGQTDAWKVILFVSILGLVVFGFYWQNGCLAEERKNNQQRREGRQ